MIREFIVSVKYFLNMPNEYLHTIEITVDAVDETEAKLKAEKRFPNITSLEVVEKIE